MSDPNEDCCWDDIRDSCMGEGCRCICHTSSYLTPGEWHARLLEERDAARVCAELLVRLVRPMYAGPTGDQGLNDPFYAECQRAIDRYKRSLTWSSPPSRSSS